MQSVNTGELSEPRSALGLRGKQFVLVSMTPQGMRCMYVGFRKNVVSIVAYCLMLSKAPRTRKAVYGLKSAQFSRSGMEEAIKTPKFVGIDVQQCMIGVNFNLFADSACWLLKHLESRI